ncbi:hypothetical protein [Paenibacillus alvei]|uniref:Uncharacterized protein n=1 Tax=Paenibacillus alvei TaxID=44250 RepID=A0A383RMQ6_PAEAL|nr:hypothetical protein [Paenibacillus alvei]SYX87669.1 protein of unknown function [Paenibacillus alvei]
MTREQILSMTPGRELDAIVCELIYGWRRIKGPKTDYEGLVNTAMYLFLQLF